MSQIFDFERIDQQSMEPRQGLVYGSASESGWHSSLPTTAQLTRIFSAAICSLVMVFFFLILSHSSAVDEVIEMQPLFTQAGQVVLAGAALALGVVLFTGIPLAVVVWRSTPRSRFLLAIPFLAIVLPLVALIGPVLRLALPAFLVVGIPLAVVIWRSTPRSRFLLTISFLTIFLPVVALILHVTRLASLIFLFGDLLLTLAVWRLTPPPRIRLGLLIPFLASVLLLLTIIMNVFLGSLIGSLPFIGAIGQVINDALSYNILIIGSLGTLLVCALICGTPIISTIAINSGIRQATVSDKWLRFARLPSRLVVFALIVMFLGLLFWGIYLALFAPALFFTLLFPLNAPWNSWLLILIGMLISVIVAARALSPSPIGK